MSKKKLFVVSGRIPFQDDDTLSIIAAPSLEEAEQAFRDEMNTNRTPEAIAADEMAHGTSVFVVSSQELGEILPGNRLAITCGDYSGDADPEDDPVAALIAAHGGDEWGSHPNYPRSDWQYEVENGDTGLSYWEWVLGKVESDEEGGAA